MTRRRSETCRVAVLDATVEIMEERGYLALTVEEVARRAHAGKQTIYRHWGGKQRLALDAFAHKMASHLTAPDHGNVHDDLRAFVDELVVAVRAPNKSMLIAGLLAEAHADPEFGRAFRDAYIATKRRPLLTVFQRAIARGELTAEADLDVMVDLTYGPVWYRLLFTGAGLDDAFVDGLIAAVIRSARPLPSRPAAEGARPDLAH